MVLIGRLITSAFGLTSQGGSRRLPTCVRHFFCKTIYVMTLERVFLFGLVNGFYMRLVCVNRYDLTRGRRGLLYIFASYVYKRRLIRNI